VRLCSMGILLPPEKKAQPHPIFGPCLLWPNGWMGQDATWYGGKPRRRRRCVRRGPSSPVKGTQQPSLFGQCLFWPRSPISATAELLLPKTSRNTLKYHLVTVEPPFTVKTIDWMHQTGPKILLSVTPHAL